MRVRLLWCWSVAGCLAFGQAGSVAGPSAGYVFDGSAKGLRQIRGVPGAALLTGVLDLGISPAGAAVSPRGDSAIAVADDGSTHLFRLADGAAAEVAVQGLFDAPSRVVFSPSGTAATLYRGDAVQIVKGLPGSPDIGHPLPVPSAAGVPATAAAAAGRLNSVSIAVSDDGACLLIAREKSIVVVNSPGSNRVLMDAHAGAVVAFAPGGHDAAVVTGGTLSLFQDVAGASTRQDFPGAGAAIGLAFSADGGKLVTGGLRAATVWDRSSGNRQQVDCDCRVDGIVPTGSWFRLNEAGAGPVWLLDAAAVRMYFVPAPAAPSAQVH
ncbi:MAG TPA: hypothetical protein VMH28_26705 [Candidatus Acidoferrales bacterium]|nr:hypothetical protein [Candidatus Acidoferrales bacterium]